MLGGAAGFIKNQNDYRLSLKQGPVDPSIIIMQINYLNNQSFIHSYIHNALMLTLHSSPEMHSRANVSKSSTISLKRRTNMKW